MTRERNLRFATIALVGAGLLFGYAFLRALVVSDPPALPDASVTSPAVNRPAAPGPSVEGPLPTATAPKKWTGLTSNALQLAVETDPFQPDRVRAPERYRLPGEEVVVEEPPPPVPTPPPPQFRVLGTIAGAQGGGIAVIQTPTGSRVLGVGESLNGFTLASVSPRNATVEGNGGRRYSLNVEEAMPTRAGRGARGGRAGAPAQDGPGGRGGNNFEQAAQLQNAMERLRQMGVGGVAMEQVQRLMDQMNRESGVMEFRSTNGERVEIVRPGTTVSGDRIIIRPRVDTMSVPMTRQND